MESAPLPHATLAYSQSLDLPSCARVIPTCCIAVNDWSWLRESAIHRGTVPGSTCAGLHSGEGSAAGNARCRLQDQALRDLHRSERTDQICAAGREAGRHRTTTTSPPRATGLPSCRGSASVLESGAAPALRIRVRVVGVSNVLADR